MRTNDILTALIALDESPWSDLKGKPLNAPGLALKLRQYAIKRKKVRFGAETAWGYARSDLVDAWTRYLPGFASPESGTSGTEGPKADGTTNVDVPDCVPDVPDDDPQKGTPEATESADVPDVPDVPDSALDEGVWL